MVLPKDSLNSKLLKQIKKHLADRFGMSISQSYVWMIDKNHRVYVAERECVNSVLGVYIDTVGLYIGEWRHDQIRFSIEGAQLFGPMASKSIIDVKRSETITFLQGDDQEMKKEMPEGFVLLRCDADWIGCGKLKDNKLKSFVPKNRRLIVDVPD